MAYATLPGMKERLDIDASDTTHDTELTNCGAYGDDIIDHILAPHTSVPLSSPPTLILEIANDVGALEFQRRRGSVDRETDVFAEAKKRLDLYIRRYFKPGEGVLKRSGTAEEVY